MSAFDHRSGAAIDDRARLVEVAVISFDRKRTGICAAGPPWAASISALSMDTKVVSTLSPRASRSVIAREKPSKTSLESSRRRVLPIALGEGGDDHLVGGLAPPESPRIEAGLGGRMRRGRGTPEPGSANPPAVGVGWRTRRRRPARSAPGRRMTLPSGDATGRPRWLSRLVRRGQPKDR